MLLATHAAMAQFATQHDSLRCLSTADGLSSSLTYGLQTDHDGFLWIATFNGLNRYDAYAFTHFLPDPGSKTSISGGKLQRVLVARDGTVWIGGDKLNRFDPSTQTFTQLAVSDGLAIESIYEDSGGLIWIGGAGLLLRSIMRWVFDGGIRYQVGVSTNKTAQTEIQLYLLGLRGQIVYNSHGVTAIVVNHI